MRSNASEEVYPGAPGMIVREEGCVRVMQSMTWELASSPEDYVFLGKAQPESPPTACSQCMLSKGSLS